MYLTMLPQFEIDGAAVDAHGNLSGRVVLKSIPVGTPIFRDLRLHLQGFSDNHLMSTVNPGEGSTKSVSQVSVEKTLHQGFFSADMFPSCWPFRLAVDSKRRSQGDSTSRLHADTDWTCNDDDESLYYWSGLSPCLPPSCSAELVYRRCAMRARVYYRLFASVSNDPPIRNLVMVGNVLTLLVPAHVPTTEQLVKMQKLVSEEQLHAVESLPISLGPCASSSNMATRVKSLLLSPPTRQDDAQTSKQGLWDFRYRISLKTHYVHHQSETIWCEIAMEPQFLRDGEEILAPKKVPPVHLRTVSLTLCGEFSWRWLLPTGKDASNERGRWADRGERAVSYEDQQVVKYDNLNLSEQDKRRHTIGFRFDDKKTICSFATLNLRHKNFLNCTIETECGGHVHTTTKCIDIALVGAKDTPSLPLVMPAEAVQSNLEPVKSREFRAKTAENVELFRVAPGDLPLSTRQYLQYRQFKEFLQEHGPEVVWSSPMDPQYALYLQFQRFQESQQEQVSTWPGSSVEPPPYSDKDGDGGVTGESGKKKIW